MQTPAKKRSRNEHRLTDDNPSANTDWSFRLKVLCSEKISDDDVLPGAVQGLMQICLPEDVLDKASVNVVEQHMREAKVSPERITVIRDLFHECMIHHGAQLYAGYLNTPARLKLGLSSLLDATGADKSLLGELTQSAHSPGSRCSSQSAQTGPSTDDSEPIPVASDNELTLNGLSTTDGDERITNQANSTNTRRGDQNRISKTWRWNVDPKDMRFEELLECFSHPTDLFAYHALPVIRTELGTAAKRADIRKKMDATWADLPNDVRERWQGCLNSLRNRDLSMLQRLPVSQSTLDPRATPYPRHVSHIENQGDNTVRRSETYDGNIPGGSGLSQLGDNGDAATEINIKLEHQHKINRQSSEASNLVNVGPERFPSQPEPSNHRVSAEVQSNPPTPIVDLLWGLSPLSSQDYRTVAKTLKDRLDERVPVDTCSIEFYEGTTNRITKGHLHDCLFSALRRRNMPTSATRQRIEDRLVLWIVYSITAFPELSQEPFVFAYMRHHETPVVDLLCTSAVAISKEKEKMIRTLVLGPLKDRKVNLHTKFRSQTTGKYLKTLLDDKKHTDTLRRVFLELRLRYIALDHKQSFPELANTALVQAWTDMTGFEWK
ncbi:hypothetical protein M011DRAFT_480202 [Sporormia fimetaria CBS 119925]|uniref:Uncharacterized protein n=1 Tax=Sporormia fimetaria CBS 119925 TaxID=1340428 RepID=A0A6A6V2Q0_9PLEO|nr:hypothetical protein M011DRAFT_480202 [Sporormia fimetaria CBS 119925]